MSPLLAPIVADRHLPVHQVPLNDETWTGYLDRLAGALSASPRVLRQHLGLGPHGDHWAPSHRDHGVAISSSSAARLCPLLGLTVEQITGMHLQRYHGSLLNLSAGMVEALDPCGAGSAVPKVGANITRAGWAHYRPATHGCPDCLRAEPGRWRLSWRLRWCVVCVEHRRLISSVAEPAGPSPGVSERLLTAQRHLLALADGIPGPGGRPAWELVNDTAAAIELALNAGDELRGWPRELIPAPQQMAELLPGAWQWASGGPAAGGAQMDSLLASNRVRHAVRVLLKRRALAQDSPVRAGLDAALTTTPAHTGRAPRRTQGTRRRLPQPLRSRMPACVPQLLPWSIFSGDLSDLLYPMSLRTGPVVAAIACVVQSEGVAPPDAAAALGRPPSMGPYSRAMRLLSEHGREERFWSAVFDATTTLARAGIDYRRRRALVEPSVDVAMSRIPGADEGLVTWWVSECWAGNVTAAPPGPRNGYRERSVLQRFDTAHGQELMALLDPTRCPGVAA